MHTELQAPSCRADLEHALQSVDRVLARKDDDEGMDEVSKQFSDAIQAMVRLRNGLSPSLRAASASDGSEAQHAGSDAAGAPSLPQVNALISLMAGIEYPVGGIHWPRIQRVSEELRKMLGAVKH